MCYSALILKSRPSGEANRDVWLLTAEAGIIRATVFGGPKSRLRSYASPFHSGQAWVYHDPAKETSKLSDFDVQSWRPGLRELYERMTAAATVTETVLVSHGGGGSWNLALHLAQEALDALSLADSETCVRIQVCFLWQWADFLGLRPGFESCSQCGKEIPSGSMGNFSLKDGGMFCSACRGGGAGFVEAGPGCRKWLEMILPVSPSQLNRFTLDAASFSEARSLTTALLSEALGKRLSGW